MKTTTQPTVTSHTEYHHMPDCAAPVDCHGLTLRQALRTLRTVDWGDMGGTYSIELSDGSWMCVELVPAVGSLTRTQRCVRYDVGVSYPALRQIAVYPIAAAA